jgi:hypothetical protein
LLDVTDPEAEEDEESGEIKVKSNKLAKMKPDEVEKMLKENWKKRILERHQKETEDKQRAKDLENTVHTDVDGSQI